MITKIKCRAQVQKEWTGNDMLVQGLQTFLSECHIK